MIDDQLAQEIKNIYSAYHAREIDAETALEYLEIAIAESNEE